MFPVMLFSTVLGVLFAFCGLMGGVAFFLEAQQGMSLSAFLQGFAAATWPLIVSCALFLLQGILKEVSALREAAEDNAPPLPQLPAKKPTAPAAPEEDAPTSPAAAPAKAAPVYFPVRETPQGPRIVRPAEDTPAAPAEPADDGLTFFKTR